MLPSVSIVVPVYNRGQALQPFLAALATLDYPPDRLQLVLADDGSTDETPSLARRFAAQAPFQTVYLPLAKGTRAEARNRGAAIARADLLLFLDGDVIADPGLMRAHVDAHARLGTGVAVIGHFRAPPMLSGLGRIYAERFHSQFWAIDDPDRLPFGFFYTTNLSLERAAFDQVGGFDGTLPFLEDVELGFRWQQAGGHRLAYAPAAGGVHDHTFDLEGILRRQRMIGDGLVALAQRQPTLDFAVRATRRARRWRRLGRVARFAGDCTLTIGARALRAGERRLPRALLTAGLRAAMGYAKLQGSVDALERTEDAHDAGAAPARPPVTILLLDDLSMDGRVIKTTRSLQAAGYAVTVYCLAGHPPALALPDLGGAAVRWVTAPRPIAALSARLRRRGIGRTQVTERTAGHEAVGGSAGPVRLLRDLRAIGGTLWLNLVLAWVASRTPAALIHANDLDTLPAGVLLRRKLGAALVYDAHELYPEMQASVSPFYAGLWRLLEHRLIGAACAVVTVNDSIADELRRRHRLAWRPAVVMNCPPLEALPRGSASRDDETVALLYHGRFHAERGLTDLVRAMPLVDARAVLYLRGSGPLLPILRAAALECGVAARVRFLDPVPPDRLVAELGGFAVGLVPYLPTSLNNYLCTPNKLFEYLMGGLAVVASDLPELRAVIEGRGAGLLYRPGDPRHLATAINTLLADPDRLQRCRDAARQAAVDTYHWEAQALILRDVYGALIGPPSWAPTAAAQHGAALR